MPSKKDKKIRLTPTQKLKEEIKILKNEIDSSKEKKKNFHFSLNMKENL